MHFQTTLQSSAATSPSAPPYSPGTPGTPPPAYGPTYAPYAPGAYPAVSMYPSPTCCSTLLQQHSLITHQGLTLVLTIHLIERLML
ncbi:uncharacterized protein LOC122007107 isoform X2 [Zingiber officinale]|uniref:uncharacterized protein LOC122007107 isoform X2 n=1 Tax=Zingiber officinale TaxID=94328 RepID=UPI001C4BDB27|nr:uncharacterized protein LOC122007107 isoform X2 [Zingiber officinale]